MRTERSRRDLIALTGAGATVLLVGIAAGRAAESNNEVGAVEDLMREHGIIRRSILVYRNSASRLRAGGHVDPKLLERTARLLRSFGEDYHERKLEEEHLFPAIRKAGGRAAGYIETLLEQHRRGREITEYILGVVSTGQAPSRRAEPLAKALDGFELMYEHHAAREDTIVFPAWKNTMTKQELAEIGEKFEEIERQQFGTDGFEQAERQISAIETELEIGNIAQFTPAQPQKL